jgi:prevent-host-death family protein
MNIERDIHPLTDFKRNTPHFLAQLKETGQPVVLTINGKAELVVQDAASYQKLADLAERLETIQAVKESLASIDRGEGTAMDDVFNALEKQVRQPKAQP